MSRPLMASLRGISHRCVPKGQRHISASSVARQQSNFLETFIQQNEPPQAAIKHFTAIEWTREMAQDTAYEAFPFYSRHFNEKTGENRFFSGIVNTKDTIPHVLALRRKDIIIPSSDHQSERQVIASETPPDLICLMSLGPDLMSHATIVHGGFQCVIFDEVIRHVVLLHHNNVCEPGPRDTHFTVNMTTTYSAPLSCPSDVLVRAWLMRREGRKWLVRAEIVDRDGFVVTSAEAMWITARKSLHRHNIV